MIAQDNDIYLDLAKIYASGYRSAERDTVKIILEKLHERANLLQNSLPELSEGLRIAADIISENFKTL